MCDCFVRVMELLEKTTLEDDDDGGNGRKKGSTTKETRREEGEENYSSLKTPVDEETIICREVGQDKKQAEGETRSVR